VTRTVEARGTLEHLGGRFSPAVVDEPINITGVTYDSRKVEPGFAFFCITGEMTDGNNFIPDAIASGAKIIVTEKQPGDAKIPYVVVPDVRHAMALMSAEFYGYPSRQLRVIGVTGTNGKTTTTHLIEGIFNACGKPAGLIGTLGARYKAGDEYSDVKHTTPQAADLQRMLATMRDGGCQYVSMEVSSHALAQKRVAACEFAVAVLTNITQDHLDFHKTMENYWKSKRLLFEDLVISTHSNKAAVLNYDDPLYEQFVKAVPDRVRTLSYGWEAPADIYVKSVEWKSGGTLLSLSTPYGAVDLKLKLSGRFNVYNVMAALAVSIVEGLSIDAVTQSLETFPGVAGRFEVVSTGGEREPLCIVDYAHTPDGLDNVLKAAVNVRPEGGKLIVVFGCGGDRDASKRPQMGEIAESRADEVVVTSDNPRSEDPQQIIANILAGIQRMKNVKVEPDRSSAIRLAVLNAGEKDVVVIAGKGHENYQILADRTIPFDDKSEVQKALNARQAQNCGTSSA
jgi:UDP-N-acetylmuramoyl-L-alanyl-D-glutamate--2,6-diaminopimelate ligase